MSKAEFAPLPDQIPSSSFTLLSSIPQGQFTPLSLISHLIQQQVLPTPLLLSVTNLS